jgi:hypothetical protein
MKWCNLETVAPEIAQLGKERFGQTRVALLATVCKDGSPRISPVEPFFAEGQLLFGTMSWSLKTRDLLRDPRCVLHSAITGPDNGEGEFKLYGRVVEVDEQTRNSCKEGWWIKQPPDAVTVFALNIERAAFISWDTEHGKMTARRWSPRRGYSEMRRNYP